MAGPFDFLHIKGRTAGSSNELSFDVLDAARRDLDDRRRANRVRTQSIPDASKGSYQGVAGTSTLSAVPEVERRKKMRRARAIRNRAIAVVLIAILAVAAGFAGYRFYQDKMNFTGRFTALIDQFIDIDQSLVQVDALMNDPLNSLERNARDDILKSFNELGKQLDVIETEANSMIAQADSGGIASLSELTDAAQARQDMLTAAADAFKLSDIANRQIEDSHSAWSKVLSGDAAAREATELSNNATTEEATRRAREKTEEAIADMTAGRAQLVAVERGIHGLDYSVEISYIDQRLISLDLALSVADALLAGDRAAATAANEAYNAADQAAVELAKKLPLSLADQVKALYADEIDQKKTAYSSARAAATTADSALRSELMALTG